MALVAISSTSRALELGGESWAATGQYPAPLLGPGAHIRVLGPAQGTGVNWGVSSKDWDGKGPASPAVVAHGLLSVMRREQRL